MNEIVSEGDEIPFIKRYLYWLANLGWALLITMIIYMCILSTVLSSHFLQNTEHDSRLAIYIGGIVTGLLAGMLAGAGIIGERILNYDNSENQYQQINCHLNRNSLDFKWLLNHIFIWKNLRSMILK